MKLDPLATLFAELGRLRHLTRLERALRSRGFTRIAGVDEAGRGSLAGPVVAAAVILPGACVLPGLDDSKLVEAVAIDAGDILRASLEAMRQAVIALDPAPEVLLVDAVRVPGVTLPQVAVIHGDALSASIAAASIVAKVYRDGLLDELARQHPAYGFDQHKGYGTPEHWAALRQSGPCPEHRLTYRGVVPEAGDAPIGGRPARRRG